MGGGTDASAAPCSSSDFKTNSSSAGSSAETHPIRKKAFISRTWHHGDSGLRPNRDAEPNRILTDGLETKLVEDYARKGVLAKVSRSLE